MKKWYGNITFGCLGKGGRFRSDGEGERDRERERRQKSKKEREFLECTVSVLSCVV